MAPGIDMTDKNAWDDSLLINSWDDAVTEYKKYHSIHQSGKRLEDVLTKAELRELREDYEDVMEEVEVNPETEPAAQMAIDEVPMDAATPHLESDGVEHHNHAETVQRLQELNRTSQSQNVPAEAPVTQEDPLASVPQVMLQTVQDENLKNIMMSWYYAGYYTGLHVGQQGVAKGSPPKD